MQKFSVPLNICKTRDDLDVKVIEIRLLNASDLVAAEARYQVPCRTSFENHVPKFEKRGLPTSTQKLILVEKASLWELRR